MERCFDVVERSHRDSVAKLVKAKCLNPRGDVSKNSPDEFPVSAYSSSEVRGRDVPKETRGELARCDRIRVEPLEPEKL